MLRRVGYPEEKC